LQRAQFIATGFVALIGGGFGLAIGISNPSHDRPVSIVFVVAGLWGVATAIGVSCRWRWARISTVIFAGLIAYGAATFAPVLAFLRTPVRPGNSLASEPRLLFFFAAVAVAAFGLWWIVLFSTDRSRNFFKIHTTTDSISLGISVIGWYLIATGAFGFLALLPLRRRPVTMHYGFVFAGWQAIVTNVLYSAISFYLGTSLLRRKRQGPQLAIYYGLFLLLDICVFLFRPDREARVNAYNSARLTYIPGMVSRFTTISLSHFLQLTSIEWAVLTIVAIWLLAIHRNDFAVVQNPLKDESLNS
jgi:hypothetical protein